MFRKETLQQVAAPAVFLLFATVICSLLFDYSDRMGIVALLIEQFFALFTCYFIVIYRRRERVHIWVNYFVWFVLMNIGNIAIYYGWRG